MDDHWFHDSNILLHNQHKLHAAARECACSPTDLVERLGGGEAQRGLGRAAEELQHGHSGRQLLGRRVLHADDGVRRLVDDHLALVAQTALDELEQRAVAALVVLLQQLAGDADEQAVGVGRLERAARELRHQLRHRQAVRLADVVQQAQRVVLHLSPTHKHTHTYVRQQSYQNYIRVCVSTEKNITRYYSLKM